MNKDHSVVFNIKGFNALDVSEPPVESGLFEAILDVAERSSYKYSFSYYEPDDIKQEVILKCLQIAHLYSGIKPIDAKAFFSTCATNYLKNLKRDNYVHIMPPCMPGGYAANQIPEELYTGYCCLHWDNQAPKSDPCHWKLYETCEAWLTYKKYVQRLLNAANPITIDEEITDSTYTHDVASYDLDSSMRDRIPNELAPYYNKLIAGEKIPAKFKLKIQQICSGVLYG